MTSVAKPGLSSALWALILREMETRFGRRALGYAWALLEPGVYVVLMLSLFYIMDRQVRTEMPMPLFILTGICPWLIFMRIDNYLRVSIQTNIPVLYHPILTPLHIYLSRFILEGCTAIVFAMLALAIYGILWDVPQVIPVRPELVVAGTCLSLLMGLGVGTCLAPIAVRFPGVSYCMAFVIRSMFVTAGIYFLPDYAPPQLKPVILWNPMTHAVGLFRSGFVREYPAHGLMPWYTVLVAMVLILGGLVMERFVRKWTME